ncbi:MAG: nucleotidyltransferase domain-containing protein, partial [Bifidobacteriaceae bacterium]|nr:nucleotidyltransferase domain-containing protein [Bifidobacteriaceae bacterium]
MPNPAPGPKAPAEQFAEVPEGSSTFRDLGLARRREGPLAAAWWAKGQAGRAHRTQLLRTALTRLWDEALETTGVDPGSTAGCAVALGAVGSLGRGQVGPASDLDLVVIYEGREWTDTRRQALAKALWYPIWDAGFDLDQSVRSLAECRRIASADLPAASGLLSLRAVAGQRELAERAASAVLADWRGAARRRLEELSADIAARE